MNWPRDSGRVEPKEVAQGLLEEKVSSPKKRIVLILKRSGSTSLADIAKELGVSRMAALRHLAALEDRGLVERSARPGGRGRPRAYFALTRESARLFPEAYAHMTMMALEFIESKLGREGVVDLLEKRSRELYDRHKHRFDNKDFRGRVEELAAIRDEGGYMAEVGPAKGRTLELLEFNCPIRAVAENYWEACAAETKLFEWLLQADVDASHRVVAGDPVCRFLIRKSPAPPDAPTEAPSPSRTPVPRR